MAGTPAAGQPASKKPVSGKAAVSKGRPRPKADKAKATPSKRRPVRMVLGHPSPPPELAGKWVAWSRDRRIIASGDTLAGVMDHIASKGIKGASYQLLPSSVRGR
jgi:hypothetical protein